MSSLLRYQLSAIRYQLLKIFLALFTLTTYYLLLTTSPAFAQSVASPAATTNYEPITTNYYSPQSPHTASLAIYNFSHAVSCILIGQSPIAPCLEYKFVKDATGIVRSVPVLSNVNTSNGVLGMTLSMIGEVISTPPVRSSEFIADLGEQIGVKNAHAQVGGSGSGVLSPIFKLWEVSRNISYLAMIIIFIVVGFMVMFRQRLNPQTVVSIQMALPGLVIGLVMITFSYFIASLISDVAFVGTNVVGYYFSLARGSGNPPAQIIDPRTGAEGNVLTIFSNYIGIINWTNSTEMVRSLWDNLPQGYNSVAYWLAIFSSGLIFQQVNQASSAANAIPFLGEGIKTLTSSWFAVKTVWDGPYGVGLVLSWVAWIVLLYSMIKLLFRLIQNLLNIIFLTIAAPFYFLATSLPGRQGLLPNWFFNMLCNVLAFPAVIAVFYFVAFLLPNTQSPFVITGTPFSFAGGTAFPLLGGLKLEYLNILLAFGALVATPSIPDIICRAVGRPGQLGALAAGAIGGAIAGGQRYGSQLAQSGPMAGQAVSALYSKPGYSQTEPGGPIVKSFALGSGGQLGGIGKTIYAGGQIYRGFGALYSDPRGTIKNLGSNFIGSFKSPVPEKKIGK